MPPPLFMLQNVSVTSVRPTHGPVSGGTVLSISGSFLNIGSNVVATLDDLPCIVNRTQSSSHCLVCVTSRGTLVAVGVGDEDGETLPRRIRKLKVTVDGAERTLRDPFTYLPDPRILELKPRRSPWSGGRLVTVHGTHLNAVQAPLITVLFQDHILNSSACTVLSADQMECPSPPVDRAVLHALRRERRNIGDPPYVPLPSHRRSSVKVSRSGT